MTSPGGATRKRRRRRRAGFWGWGGGIFGNSEGIFWEFWGDFGNFGEFWGHGRPRQRPERQQDLGAESVRAAPNAAGKKKPRNRGKITKIWGKKPGIWGKNLWNSGIWVEILEFWGENPRNLRGEIPEGEGWDFGEKSAKFEKKKTKKCEGGGKSGNLGKNREFGGEFHEFRGKTLGIWGEIREFGGESPKIGEKRRNFGGKSRKFWGETREFWGKTTEFGGEMGNLGENGEFWGENSQNLGKNREFGRKTLGNVGGKFQDFWGEFVKFRGKKLGIWGGKKILKSEGGKTRRIEGKK